MEETENIAVTPVKPTYKMMALVVNQCVEKNMGNAVFSVFLHSIVRSFAMGLIMAPAVFMLIYQLGSERAGYFIPGALLAITCSFLAMLIALMLDYGLTTIFCRMTEKKHVTIGYLFIGFTQKELRPRIIKTALVFMLFEFVFPLILITLVSGFYEQIESLLKTNDVKQTVYYIAAFFIPVILLLYSFISFVWIIIYSEPETKIFKAFGKSISFTAKHFFNYIGFIIYSAGIALPLFIASYLLQILIPDSESVSSLQLVEMLLQFTSIIFEFIVMVRVCFAMPVYWFSHSGNIKFAVQTALPECQDETSAQNESLCSETSDSESSGSKEN